MTAASDPGAPVVGPATGQVARYRHLDNLKVGLIAAVIAVHGVLGYVDIRDVWPYSNVQETALSTVSVVALFAVVGPFGFFTMALLFLVAGLLTPASVARKGPGRFARDRGLRLGLPYLVFFLVLWPVLLYAVYRRFGHFSGSYWAFFRDNYPDSGPLWFVGVLLLLSLAYAGWCRIPPGRPHPGPPAHRAGPGAARPGRRGRIVPDPADLSVRRPGTDGPQRVPVARVPRTVRGRRRGRRRGLAHRSPRPDPPGGPLTVFGSIWLLAVAQRHLDRPWPHGAALARSAYGAFILQGVFLLGLAVALRPVPVVAEVKALVVAVGGVLGSFALSWLLITRVPPLRRVL